LDARNSAGLREHRKTMASRRPDSTPERPAPRLYVVTLAIADAAELARVLDDVLPVADIAAVLLRLAVASERDLIERTKAIAQTVQARNVALVLDGRVDVAIRAGADGAHVSGTSALGEAIGLLHPARIAGAGGLRSRHDAMLAGEAGADYVMFGEPDIGGRRPALEAVVERVSWWAEVFQPPCVGFAGAPAEIAPIAQAGADFIALGEWVWTAASGPTAAIRAAADELAVAEPVS
jgi:thiamine-phosphate pyrophosphorylase